MFSLIRMVIGAALLGMLAYAFFFVDIGGKSVGGHVADIWKTPVVQGKVDLLRDSVKQELEERLAEAGSKMGEEAGRKLARAATEPSGHEFSQVDRETVDDIIKQAGSTP